MKSANFLSDRIIRFSGKGAPPDVGTLPEVYSALIANQVDSFPALRPHQRHAWHAFLVQLGALAMHEAAVQEPPEDAEAWRRLIRGLTPDFPDDEPWHLVVEDITRPAFLQPPASEPGLASEYGTRIETPDKLDMLVTSKDHDLKSAVAADATIEDWIFALITLQTSEGFGGAGNYGISRMNGGLGSRPAFSITPSTRPGAHVRRDIIALLHSRDRLLENHPMVDDGIKLVWTIPWDGQKAEALNLPDLDPFYIEICRRLRLTTRPDGSMYATRATSKAPRIEARALAGITGDPWTPVNSKQNKSLTLGPGGFNYRRTVDYFMTPDWQRPPLLDPTETERRSGDQMVLVARGMVRGQGKTEGYHERMIPLSRPVVRAMGRTGGLNDLGGIARDRIADVGKIQRFLRHAVSVFAAGGNTESAGDEHRARANPWANRLDQLVDPDFFATLQDEFEIADPDGRRLARDAWLRDVIDRARELLHQAEDSLPCPAIQRHRARVRADSVFEGRVRGRNGFGYLYAEEQDEVIRDD